MSALLFVVPEATAPSGGHTYDQRVAAALGELGRPVRTVALGGAWPRPGRGAVAELSAVLAEAPDGSRVLVDGLVACGVPEAVLPHARRLRIAVLVHLPLADETGLAAGTARDLNARERALLRGGVTVVATSAWAARRLAEQHGLERVAVVRPGVDPAPLARGSGFEERADSVPRLVCVASLTPRKGHDLLFQALSGLRDLSWTCVCAGPGTPPPHSGLEDRVRFTGAVVGGALAEVHDCADLLVLASRAETYGMVVTEALARGVPVVAARVGGVPEALGRTSDGRVPGLLALPEDAAALEHALRDWLTDRGLRERLREAARLRRSELAGWPEAARTMAQVLGL
ncbi:glycosyltransferase family 4 protein [Nocardiopsis metallicus]|uniref:Glycosyltransferase involved in cell wall biosynthesis n=1 Tax=Nocardiopsis metallicus TaxID=179819 RepID=A0A840VZY4_9ACTN|nr:glycosyltransferase family 4 protein [Nocardiopsis metallicus]MBB5490039.1 glycosyltransferase involved in cell wall biosynthesis [Nocardiopsis metallicus]